jgi:hypothetical protein
MANQRISIARVMMIIALVAANCALLREVTWDVVSYPTIWAALGLLDSLILWKLILRRTLRAGHYAFLIVFVVAYLVLVPLAAMELIHPAGPIIRVYQRITGDDGRSVVRLGLRNFGDIWLTALMALMLAWTASLGAAWLERRRGWDIAAFCRGVLVGFGIANAFALLNQAVVGMALVGSLSFYLNLAVLALCLIGGGILGRSRFKSDLPHAQEIETSTAPPRSLANLRRIQPDDLESLDGP